MPQIFRQVFARGLIKRQPFALPALVVALLRQFAPFAQAVENLAVAGMGVEPGFGKAPQLGKGAVVEAEFLIAVEDGNGGCQFVQGVGMRVDMLLQFRFAGGDVGHVAGGAHDTGIDRNFGQGQRAALAVDDGKTFGFQRLALRARGRRQIAFGFFQRHLLAIGRFHVAGAGGRQKGVIAPDQRRRPVAQPHRNGQGVENGAEVDRCRRGRDLRLDPNRRHAADGTPANADPALRRIDCRQRETCAARAQRIERRRQLGRLRTVEARLQQSLGAAIRIRTGAVASPNNQRFAGCVEQRIAFADGCACARSGKPKRAAQAGGFALFGNRPQAGGDREGDRARDEGCHHHVTFAAIWDGNRGPCRSRRQSERGQRGTQATLSPVSDPGAWVFVLSHFGTHPGSPLIPPKRRITVESR